MTSQSAVQVSAPRWGHFSNPHGEAIAAVAHREAVERSRTHSPARPSSGDGAVLGFRTRHHPGGPALIAFGLVLWALFLGTLPPPHGAHSRGDRSTVSSAASGLPGSGS